MGSLQADSEEKLEMDDSGCIQDETPPCKRLDNSFQGVQLLDLSDDVLLLILRFLAPRDLKALGYTCPRLGALVLDRSLWQSVDARAQPWGRARLRWYLARALHAGTRRLLLAGHAREARECLGHVNQTREEIEAARLLTGDKDGDKEEDNNNTEPDAERERERQDERPHAPRIIDVPALGPNAQLYIDDDRDESPEAWAWPRASEPLISDSACPGPQFTLTHRSLGQLAATCPALGELALEYCNINCNTTSITQFPATLKSLSLRGSKCYNLPLDRSFLFKIQDTMPELETLDVSECEWMEPASLLPLSKLPALKQLYACDCLRLTEFVAYASLATRYGFTKLELLDLRGSPVGDSEVSALGWLRALRQLLLSPATPPVQRPQHSHHKSDRLPARATPPPDKWEAQEPEYFKIKESDIEYPTTDKEENKHTWQANYKELNGTLSCSSTSKSTPMETEIATSSNHRSPTTSQIASCSNTKSPASMSERVKPNRSDGTENVPESSSLVVKSSKSPSKSTKKSRDTKSPDRSRPGQSDEPENASEADSPSAKSKSSPKSKSPARTKSPQPSGSSRSSAGGAGGAGGKRRRGARASDDDAPLPRRSRRGDHGAGTSREPQPRGPAQDVDAQPRHHVLYVNVGQQVHAVYRLSLDNEHIVSFNRNPRNTHSFLPPAHLDATSLVTDSAIRRFGRADGEDINYVHIGPNGPYPGRASPGARPDRSSLTHLTVTGFRHITDRSLEHLATAAPNLQFLDFSETNVTEAGVASFRSLRPECEVRYSPYVKKE